MNSACLSHGISPYIYEVAQQPSNVAPVWSGSTHITYMLDIHRSGTGRNVFTTVLAHCSSDIILPPCLPEKALSKKKKAKHVAVIPMGEKEAEEKNSFSGYSGLLTSWRTLLKEEVSLVILWHLIIVSVY